MKPDTKTIQTFIHRRAQGISLGHLANELNIPRSTLGDWNKRYADQIALGSAMNWEQCEAASQLHRETDLIRLTLLLHKCQFELQRRPMESFTNTELMRLVSMARRDYFKRRDPLLKPLERGCPSRSASAESESHDPSSAYAAEAASFPVAPDLRANASVETELNSRGPSSFQPSDNQPASSAYAANDSRSATYVFAPASETNDIQLSETGLVLPPSPEGRGNEGEGQTSSILHSEFSTLHSKEGEGQTSSSSPTQDSRPSTLDSIPSEPAVDDVPPPLPNSTTHSLTYSPCLSASVVPPVSPPRLRVSAVQSNPLPDKSGQNPDTSPQPTQHQQLTQPQNPPDDFHVTDSSLPASNRQMLQSVTSL